jgi:choline dehydrogenase-like flavoprotein
VSLPIVRDASFENTEVDVCIVGSGAGGGTLAFGLAMAGFTVVVLEKGPYYREADFRHDEVMTCRRDFWVPNPNDEPHVVTQHGETKHTNQGWISCNVGGGTTHMSGFFHRLHPEDFRMRERYGTALGDQIADWPIDYAELEPYYAKVESEIGVSGQAGEHPFEPPRSAPFPMPPLAFHPLAGLVDKGARAMGLHPFQTPRAILSEARNGRSACVYCSFCGNYGCEVGAKSSTMAAVIPRAVATGRCEIRPDCMVFEIPVDASGRVTGVRYFDKTGATREQKARLVCVSATSIETARLLLNSKSKRFPDGLANDSGLVGRNLTFSTLGKGWAEFENDKIPKEFKSETTIHFLQRSIQDYYFLKERAGQYDKGGTISFVLPHKNPIARAQVLAERHEPRLWGEALQKALHRFYHEVQEIEFEVFGEFLPNPGTYVDLEKNTKDKFGLPCAHIHVENHKEDGVNSERLVGRGRDILLAAGAESTGAESIGGTTFILQHGTCRFGKDPKTSVLDPSCRAHSVPNLYCVDGSFMPSSGGVPTTMTIMANAFRVADRIIARRRAG